MPSPRTVCPECGKPVRTVKEGGQGKRSLVIAAGAALLLLAVALAWLFLGKNNKEGAPAPSATEVTCNEGPLLRFNGSDVLGRSLTPELVRAWLRSLGATDIASRTQQGTTTVVGVLKGKQCRVEIRGPNTTDGIAALGRGSTDIAMSARQISATEADGLKSLGNMLSPAAEYVVAIDALAVVVHPSNPVRKLQKGEIADVLEGRVTRWNAIGGLTAPISVYLGNSGVRAADTAQELLGNAGGLVRRSSSDAGVVEGVAGDPNGIGIVSYPPANGTHTVAVSEEGATAFFPNPDTIATQSYPLTRRLYFYTDPTPSNRNTRRFLEFVQGKEGQEVVGRSGYGGQNVEVVEASTIRADASKAYRDVVANGRQLNIAFRFRTGVAELDNKAIEDVDRLIDYLRLQDENGNESLMLIGFADAQGADAANMQLSRRRAEAISTALSKGGVKSSVVRWFGEEQPVGDNSTAAGRDRNRRVEVWVTG